MKILEFKKIAKYISLYGFERTIVKIASRKHIMWLKYLICYHFKFKIKSNKYVSLIGCGQFGFSAISFFLLKVNGPILLECYDLNSNRSRFTASFFGYKMVDNFTDIMNNEICKIIYVASNHYSHTDYAIKALNNNKDIYIEKPISVNWNQFALLKEAISKSQNKIYVGYNRPYSKAARFIVNKIYKSGQPISLSCFISGHLIAENHWYRNKEEGTRICGNVGHWIDLMIHFMNQRGAIPKEYQICILQANSEEIDDNLNISIRTELNDIVSIFITSRTEPFEGIKESINLQCGDNIFNIDDFKRLTLWNRDKKITKRYFYKDVGHKLSINQPFLNNSLQRDWKEIEISTYIMLFITDMVKHNVQSKKVILQCIN